MDTLSSPTLRSRGNLAYVGRAWPKASRRLRNMRSGAWACGATEGGLRALQRCVAPKPTLPHPTRAHYLGDIMRVPGYGRGCAGAMSWGAIHPLMGGRDGAFCTHPDFRSRSSYEPGLRIFYKYDYGHIYGPLTSPLRSLWGARDRRAGPSTAEARQDPAL